MKKARYAKFMKLLPRSPAQSLDVKEVWKILCNPKSASDDTKLKDLLYNLGVYEAEDLDCLDEKDKIEISNFLKPAKCKQLKKKFIEPFSPPPSSETLTSPGKNSNSSSTLQASSASRYSISGFEIIIDETKRLVPGIKFGYFIDFFKNKTEVVLKFSETEHCRNIKREAEILVALQFLGSVVKILGTNPFENLPHFIVLKHSGRSLSEFMINGNVKVRKLFIPLILEAMLSIHSAGYAHNDVKPSNILIHYNSETGMNSAILCDFDQSSKFGFQIISGGFTPGWSGLGARLFPRVASDREDVFALGVVFGKLTNEYCNSLSVFPDDPHDSSVLHTDQEELYKALSVTGAGKEIIEDMLKLIPEERPSIQDAHKRYQRLTATKLEEDKKEIKVKLVQVEKDKEFLQDQMIDNFSNIQITLEKTQRASADNSANILKEMKKNF